MWDLISLPWVGIMGYRTADLPRRSTGTSSYAAKTHLFRDTILKTFMETLNWINVDEKAGSGYSWTFLCMQTDFQLQINSGLKWWKSKTDISLSWSKLKMRIRYIDVIETLFYLSNSNKFSKLSTKSRVVNFLPQTRFVCYVPVIPSTIDYIFLIFFLSLQFMIQALTQESGA